MRLAYLSTIYAYRLIASGIDPIAALLFDLDFEQGMDPITKEIFN